MRCVRWLCSTASARSGRLAFPPCFLSLVRIGALPRAYGARAYRTSSFAAFSLWSYPFRFDWGQRRRRRTRSSRAPWRRHAQQPLLRLLLARLFFLLLRLNLGVGMREYETSRFALERVLINVLILIYDCSLERGKEHTIIP